MGLGFDDRYVIKQTAVRFSCPFSLLQPCCDSYLTNYCFSSHVLHQGLRGALSGSIASAKSQLSKFPTNDSSLSVALDYDERLFLRCFMAALQMEYILGIVLIGIWRGPAISVARPQSVGAEWCCFGGVDILLTRLRRLWGRLVQLEVQD